MYQYFAVNVTLTTKEYGYEISWALLDAEECEIVCSSQPPGSYPSHSTITESCGFLKTNVDHKLHCKDSFTDGWNGGYLTIQGVRYCDDFCPNANGYPICYGAGPWDAFAMQGGGESYTKTGIRFRAGSIQ